ncbi:uncharacterized protein [Rutidosis leptorrhynchoides]|uniref:uncharacterized protein n=1 Tax=Rutidosis leptorrhynchoides TaxID=125765 RepID=UPI003A9A5FF0
MELKDSQAMDNSRVSSINHQTTTTITSHHLPETSGSLDDQTKECSKKILRGKYFFYDPPLAEETGLWIPISVPPMSESEHKDWSRGFSSSSASGMFPDDVEHEMGWFKYLEKDKELTMWDVVLEMLLAARGKLSSLKSSGDNVSRQVIDQAWKEMAQTLADANFGNIHEILEIEPPKWLPDSSAATCMLCNTNRSIFKKPAISVIAFC